MQYIFFDLETSDRHPIGQILNYCFLRTDQDLSVLDELAGDVKISRLQLPSPGAILVNRIDVQKHQAGNPLSEREAMHSISKYIWSVIDEAKEVILVGYNSSKFDVAYLRTSLIRNGLNPYFSGKLRYLDLLHVSRALFMRNLKFPAVKKMDSEGKERHSLSLESLSRAFGFLSEDQVQSHHSRADVLLTIDLARVYRDEYGVTLNKFRSYEPANSGNSAEPLVVSQLKPEYDPSTEVRFRSKPQVLLDKDHRSALWVDLESYAKKKGRLAIHWYNFAQGAFFVDSEATTEDKTLELAKAALGEYAKVNLKNFFTTSTCDIEQDIYRLDFDALAALEAAIWKNDERALKRLKHNKDLRVVYTRFKLRELENIGSQETQDVFSSYVKYRYQDGAQLSKQVYEDEDGKEIVIRHASFSEYLQEIDKIMEDAGKTFGAEDNVLMQSLKQFYEESDAGRVLLGQGIPLEE